MAKIKRGPKIAGILLLIVLVAFGANYAINNGWIPMAKTEPSQIPASAPIGDVPVTQTNAVTFTQPTTIPASCPKVLRFDVWAWNAQSGWLLSNGGATTTKGSLMEKYGTCVQFKREDVVDKMIADVLTCAEEYADDPNTAVGVHGLAVMGDGAPALLQAANPQLEKIGPDYYLEVVGSAGYSRGEDKFMGLPEWKTNPQAARGALIAGVLRDGDWNIAVKWAADNGIPVNPSEKTWDPNALNFAAAESYIGAATMYIEGRKEKRLVINEKGSVTGSKEVEINGVVTWTPGDVNVSQKKGGLVNIVSTYEYRAQMPNTILMIHKVAADNPQMVINMLRAIGEAGDMIKSDPKALKAASKISAAVYKEETETYWMKYFDRVEERDATGLKVSLGGSAVNNLADMQQLFGLVPGSINLFEATYTTFGNIVVQMYPNLVPTYPPISKILNTQYLEEAVRLGSSGAPDLPTFTPNAPITSTTSQRAWGEITFETGSSQFTPSATTALYKLLNDFAIAGGVAIEIHGHTDNTGTPEGNMLLSQQRADAVKHWLEQQAPNVFPTGRNSRIRTIAHGQSQPVADNATNFGRAKNRRVEIISGLQ